MVRVSHPHASTEYADLQHASSPTCYSHKWPSEGVKFENTRRAEKNKKTAARTAKKKVEGVAHLLIYRDVCLAFWLIVPPLLIVPSLACSVTSLSLYPGP